MSFTSDEVLEEFGVAAQLGSHNHNFQLARWEAQRWWHEFGFTSLRPKPAAGSVLAPIATLVCAECGAGMEHRVGVKRLIHLGPVTNCRRKAA